MPLSIAESAPTSPLRGALRAVFIDQSLKALVIIVLNLVFGVLGVSGNFEGPPLGMNLPTIAGVVGSSDDRPGVIGTSNALIGVYGFSAANAGVVGESVNSFAGYFAGNVVVTGDPPRAPMGSLLV